MNGSKVREATFHKIKQAIKDMYTENPSVYKLNMSELARRSDISRPTLIAAREEIETFIRTLPSVYNLAAVERAGSEARYRRLREKYGILECQNRILLLQFSSLFSEMYGESVDSRRFMTQPVVDSLNESENILES